MVLKRETAEKFYLCLRVHFCSMLTVLLVFTVMGAGCDRKPEKAERATGEKKQKPRSPATKRQTEKQKSKLDEWQQTRSDTLEPSMEKKLQRAKQAQRRMAKQLKGELTDSLADKSFPETVEFCKSRAPEIAKNVGNSLGVSMGRTSHKLRNPENTPPKWAKSVVEEKQKGVYVFEGPDQKLGYLHPIEMKGLCVNCHGSEKQLADGLPDILSEHYPEDEATGFSVGELRGWFWVEVVPKGS
jgi:nitrate reductase cytochrome c-type subunit